MKVSLVHATPWQRGFWRDVVDEHVIQFGLGTHVLVMDHNGVKGAATRLLFAAGAAFWLALMWNS